jgi:hypothetical protein
MSKFIKYTELRGEVMKLFTEAESEITIVSPYIKLQDEIKRALEPKMNDPEFEVHLIYGKNEHDIAKSLSKEDLDFFKRFRNLRVYYNQDLHAKFYANESKSIITSLNLHEYSLKNNIEVGVMLERTTFGIFGDNSQDTDAFEYFNDIFDMSHCVFEQHVKETNYLFGLYKKTEGVEVLEDNTKEMYKTSPQTKVSTQKMGFCIRTGVKIPFNPKQPFSAEVFKSWNQYKNKDFKEKYCHFSGEVSNGQTTFSKPILAKNWKKAMG